MKIEERQESMEDGENEREIGRGEEIREEINKIKNNKRILKRKAAYFGHILIFKGKIEKKNIQHKLENNIRGWTGPKHSPHQHKNEKIKV